MSLYKRKSRNKVENPSFSMGLQKETISSADHHDLSVVYQARAYQIVGQQISGPLRPVWGGGGTFIGFVEYRTVTYIWW